MTSLLWVGKKPISNDNQTGGDEIYDRKITALLADHFQIERMQISRQSRPANLKSLVCGIPHPRYKYRSHEVIRQFKQMAESCDEVVISWESFDHLIEAIARPVTLIVHNVMSDTLRQIMGNRAIGRLAASQSERWEKRLYRRSNVRVVALSERDQRILQPMTSSKIYVASPGCPPLANIESETFIPEVVISGSYDWLPKRRDLMRVAKEFDAGGIELTIRHDQPFPTKEKGSRFIETSLPITNVEYGKGLRIGLIPDTFIGGFKLKSTFYVANNCLLASMVDIRSEFDGLPYADEFVRIVNSLREVESLVNHFRGMANSDLFIRWNQFKVACLRRYTWSHAADQIREAICS